MIYSTNSRNLLRSEGDNTRENVYGLYENAKISLKHLRATWKSYKSCLLCLFLFCLVFSLCPVAQIIWAWFQINKQPFNIGLFYSCNWIKFTHCRDLWNRCENTWNGMRTKLFIHRQETCTYMQGLKKIWFQLVLWSSNSLILLASGHFPTCSGLWMDGTNLPCALSFWTS